MNETTGNFTVATSGSSWNGPICPVCQQGYLGRHECKGHQCDATRQLEAEEEPDWRVIARAEAKRWAGLLDRLK